MTVPTTKCPKCGSENVVNIDYWNGKWIFRCKDCGYEFTIKGGAL
jgi:transposase-like protein